MEFDYQLLIKQLLYTPVLYDESQEIVYKDTLRFTYKEFRKRVCKLANALKKAGIKQGDTVGVLDYDTHRYLECYFAVPMIGAVLHTINIRLSPEQILYTIDHAEDDILLIHGDLLPIIEQIKGRFLVDKFVLLGTNNQAKNTKLPLLGEYEEWISNEDDSYDFPTFDENTKATIFYTTGTTGMPKGVSFSHRQLVLHTLSVIATFSSSIKQNITQNDVYMPITPMFHVHAWGFPYIATFLGLKQVYPGKYFPQRLLDLMQKEKVTFSHCVPTILHMLMNNPNFDSIDLSKWQVIIGGAALSRDTCIKGLQKGINVYAAYGMSETCPVLSVAQITPKMLDLELDKKVDILIKTGKSIALTKLKVVDENFHEVKKDASQTGEIVAFSPWLTKSYFKDTKTTQTLWQNGYLKTGDVANIDELGYVKITDRAKDVIKVGGEWLSSLELEDIISLHEAVNEVAVIGIKDEKWSERPLGLVVLNEGYDEDEAKKLILKHSLDYIKKGVMIREALLLKIEIVKNIDKTSVGKIDKKNLRLKYS